MSTNVDIEADGSRVVTVNHGDGTGTRTTYDAQGATVQVEELTGLPEPPAPGVAGALEVLAAVDPAELRRVVVLGVEVTERVEALESAVAGEDPLAGVAVVKDAAVAAVAED